MAANNSLLKKYIRPISLLAGMTLVIFLAWYFSQITMYVIIALILAMLCLPLKRLLVKIKIKTFKIGNALASSLSFVAVLVILIIIFRLVFIPVANQVNAVANADPQTFDFLDSNLAKADQLLKNYNLLTPDQQLEDVITQSALDFIGKINISETVGNVLGLIGDLFMGIFSVLFIAFFLLKDIPKLQAAVVSMMPTYLQKETTHTLQRSKKLLSNYFLGLFIEILIMGGLEFVALYFMGIPNALLISVIGGVLVIIPYIGSVIALAVGSVIAVMSSLLITNDIDMITIVLQVSLTCIGCRILDNIFLQPFIAARSVKANPLEIFLVVLASGYIAGIPGMMLGIPAYTIVRVIAQEFFGNINFVKTLTKSLDTGNS